MDIAAALRGFVTIALGDLRVFLMLAFAAAAVIAVVFVALGIVRELVAYSEEHR